MIVATYELYPHSDTIAVFIDNHRLLLSCKLSSKDCNTALVTRSESRFVHHRRSLDGGSKGVPDPSPFGLQEIEGNSPEHVLEGGSYSDAVTLQWLETCCAARYLLEELCFQLGSVPEQVGGLGEMVNSAVSPSQDVHARPRSCCQLEWSLLIKR